MDKSLTSGFSKMRSVVAILTALLMSIAVLGVAAPANATSGGQEMSSVTLPGGGTFDLADITPENWDQAVEELIASDLNRVVDESSASTKYTFEVPIDDPSVPGGIFSFTVVVPKKDAITPRLGGGVDTVGVYVLLNAFDQNMLIGGGGAAVTAALCAIPGLGWIGCGAITIAVIAAAAWVSTHGMCPKTLKAYVFVPERNRCV